jgi:hypothetical protein
MRLGQDGESTDAGERGPHPTPDIDRKRWQNLGLSVASIGTYSFAVAKIYADVND